MRLSDAEWKVMHCLWRASPASARDVLEQVGGETDWAYSTVKTVLARLAEKGAVSATKRANTSLYTPTVSRAQARAAALRALLETAFDGAVGSLVHHLVDDESLGERERAELREALDRARDEEAP